MPCTCRLFRGVLNCVSMPRIHSDSCFCCARSGTVHSIAGIPAHVRCRCLFPAGSGTCKPGAVNAEPGEVATDSARSAGRHIARRGLRTRADRAFRERNAEGLGQQADRKDSRPWPGETSMLHSGIQLPLHEHRKALGINLPFNSQGHESA